ncbi:MAG: hypothetical protein D6689_04110 [Deltaproteobacteria bacterium]|nr:MAG: hypothetical protein D6689_04110 [Deltaproteobacteria bacterium]
MKPAIVTSLWELISSLQDRLERYGLDDAVIDAAVVSGVESMLSRAAPRATGDAAPPDGMQLVLAPAGEA